MSLCPLSLMGKPACSLGLWVWTVLPPLVASCHTALFHLIPASLTIALNTQHFSFDQQLLHPGVGLLPTCFPGSSHSKPSGKHLSSHGALCLVHCSFPRASSPDLTCLAMVHLAVAQRTGHPLTLRLQAQSTQAPRGLLANPEGEKLAVTSRACTWFQGPPRLRDFWRALDASNVLGTFCSASFLAHQVPSSFVPLLLVQGRHLAP